MTTTPTAPVVDIERLAASQLLFAIAERFELEATLWSGPEFKAELMRGAAQMSTLGRAVITGNTTLEHADAYATVGTRIVREVEGARRFFTAILAPPKIRARHE